MIDFSKLIDPNFKPYTPQDWEHYNEVKGNGAFGWAKDAFDAGALGFLSNVADASQEYLGVGGDLAKTLGNLADINGKTENLNVNSSGYFSNNQGALYDVFNALGSSAPMMAMTAGAGVGASIAGKAITPMLGAGTVANLAKVASLVPEASVLGKSLPLGKLALGNIASSIPESIGEAGGAIAQAREAGMSPDAVRQAGNDTFSENLKLLGASNTAESLLGLGLFSKFGKLADGATKLAKAGNVGLRAGAGALAGGFQNAYEEGVQSEIPLVALGKSQANSFDPSQWSKESQQASDVGFVVGGIMGGVGGTMGSLAGKNANTLTPVNSAQKREVVEKATINEQAIPQAVDAMVNAFMSDPNFDFSLKNISNESMKAMFAQDPVLKNIDPNEALKLVAENFEPKLRALVDAEKQAGQSTPDVNKYDFDPQESKLLVGLVNAFSTSGRKTHSAEEMTRALAGTGLFKDPARMNMAINALRDQNLINEDVIGSDTKFSQMNPNLEKDKETLYGRKSDFPTNLTPEESGVVNSALDVLSKSGKPYLSSNEVIGLVRDTLGSDLAPLRNVYTTLDKMGVVEPTGAGKTASSESQTVASTEDFSKYKSPISRLSTITREMVNNNPDTVFVFGDNDLRRGMGGQAQAMRGAKNSIGIRTKKAPSTFSSSYYTDSELASNMKKIDEDITSIRQAIASGKKVVIPSAGIGTGLAELKTRAPQTFNYLQRQLKSLHSDTLPKLKNVPSKIHSGGALGADTAFDIIANEQGVEIQHHSFDGHNINTGSNIVKHSTTELEGTAPVTAYNQACFTLGRAVSKYDKKGKNYVRNLVLRNYFQVKDSDVVLAVASIESGKGTDGSDVVKGGTGYAVEYAKQMGKPIFVVDKGQLYQYDYGSDSFKPRDTIPNLSGLNIAGVGSRDYGTTYPENMIRKIFASEKTSPINNSTLGAFNTDIALPNVNINVDPTLYTVPVQPLNGSVAFGEKATTFDKLVSNQVAKSIILNSLVSESGDFASVSDIVNSKGVPDQVHSTKSNNPSSVIHFNTYDSLTSNSTISANKGKYFKDIPMDIRYAHRLSQLLGFKDNQLVFFDKLDIKDDKTGKFEPSGISGFRAKGVSYVSSNNAHSPAWLFGHELGHKMQESRMGAKVFIAFKNKFVEALGDKLDKLLIDYANFNGFKVAKDGDVIKFKTPSSLLSRNQLLDEIICDTIADRVANGNFLELIAKEFEGKKGFFASTFVSVKDFLNVLKNESLNSSESGLDQDLLKSLGADLQYEIDTVLATRVQQAINVELAHGQLTVENPFFKIQYGSSLPSAKDDARRLSLSKLANEATIALTFKRQDGSSFINKDDFGNPIPYIPKRDVQETGVSTFKVLDKKENKLKDVTRTVPIKWKKASQMVISNITNYIKYVNALDNLHALNSNTDLYNNGVKVVDTKEYAGQRDFDFNSDDELVHVSTDDKTGIRTIHWNGLKFTSSNPNVMETPDSYLGNGVVKTDDITKTFDYQHWKVIKDFSDSDFYKQTYSAKEAEYNKVQDELAKLQSLLNQLKHQDSIGNKYSRLLSTVNTRLRYGMSFSEREKLTAFKTKAEGFVSNHKSSQQKAYLDVSSKYYSLSQKANELYAWLKDNDKARDSRFALISKYFKFVENAGGHIGRNFKDSEIISSDAYTTLCQLVGLKYLDHRVVNVLQKVKDDAKKSGKDEFTALTNDFNKPRVDEFDAFKLPDNVDKSSNFKMTYFPSVLSSEIKKVVSESYSEYDLPSSGISKAEIKKFDDAISEQASFADLGYPFADTSPLSVAEKMATEQFNTWVNKQTKDGLLSKSNFAEIKQAHKEKLQELYLDKAYAYVQAKGGSFTSLDATGNNTSDDISSYEKVDANETAQSDGEEKTLGNNASYEDEHFDGYEKNAPNVARYGLSGILKHGDISSYGSMYVFHRDAIDKLGWSYAGRDNFKKIKESLDSLFSDLENKHYYFNDLASFKLLPKNIQQDIAVKAGFDSAEDLIDGYKSTLKEFSKNPKVVAKTLEHQKITGKNYGVSDKDILNSVHSEMATKVEDYSKNDMNNPDSFPYSRSPKYYNEKFLKMILGKVAGVKEQIKNNPNSKAWFGIVDKLLRSPSKLAQMFPQFKPFYDLAVKSKLQEDSFKKQYMDKFNEAWNPLSSEEKKSLEAIFLMGDKLGRELSNQEMVELGANENVTKAYSSIRSLLNHLRDKINQVNKLTGREEIGYIKAYFPHHWDMYKVVNHSTGETSCYKSYSEASKVAKDMIAKGINASIQIDEGGFQGNFTESGNVVSHVISASELGGIPDNFLEDESLTLVEKHRFLKQLMERKGMGGYSTNVEHVIRKYVNTSARYLALEPFKYSSRILFDNTVGEGKFNAYDLDWSKDPIASYIKDYINGVCGYPTNIEKFFDHIIGQVPFIRDFIVKNTSYGSRYSVGLANMTTEAVAVTTLGFWNPATGILQLSQLANVSTLCGNKLTKDAIERLASNKLTDDDKLALRRSKVEFDSNLANEGYSKGTKSSYNDKIQKLTQKSMWMFEKGDMFVRKVAIMAGYQQGLANGLTPAEAIKYAVEINRKANFDNSVIDSSGLFRSLSVLGSVGLQFKKYGLKQLEFCYDTLISGKDMGEKKRFLATMMIMGGIMGIPFLDLFDEILKGLFGKTIDEDLRQYAIENMGTGAQKEIVEFMLYGGGSLVGIDLSRRAGQANLLGGSTENFFPAIGRTMNLIKHVRENGVTSQAIADIVPSAGNVVTGLVEGHPRGIKKVEYTPYEGLIRATGFIPIREAIERDKQKYSMANNNKDKDKKKDKKKD